MTSLTNSGVAYPSMEIALHPVVPAYAGALGILTPGTLRTAAATA